MSIGKVGNVGIIVIFGEEGRDWGGGLMGQVVD